MSHSAPAIDTPPALTPAQKAHFLTHGFVHLPACFSRAASAAFTAALWQRLGMSPTDPATWHTERTNMPSHTSVPIAEFAPKAWAAICELLGGEERVSDETRVSPRELDGWHVDGDFFLHFLDSPEQALLVISLFSDIGSGGGGTTICTDGIGVVARHLVGAVRQPRRRNALDAPPREPRNPPPPPATPSASGSSAPSCRTQSSPPTQASTR
ncbi:hypothetical protein B0H14DRAFT_3909942 [Mycena olivaceomarginata]|nr:hypothetical protein B0H14DRAFT_3909942 [Mycena olivaceomarginata]